jgi:FimV-like protein
VNSSGNNSLKNKRQNRLLLMPLPPHRRLARCIAALCGATLASASSLAFSLGLGELNSRSFLGQPLSASIELVSLEGDIDLNTLIVRQVTPDEASKMGVDILYVPYRINFAVDTKSGAPLVSVTTAEPINEPYLSIMVELRWPKGVVYREYPVLLDLPPITPMRETRPERRQVSAPSAPPQPSTSRSPSRAPVQLQLEPLATDNGKYKVQSGDTLSKIAARWREGTSQSIGDTAQWLFENNSHAFANSDINRLRAGAVLQMPDLSSLRIDEEQGARKPPSLAPLPEQGSGEGQASSAVADASETQPASTRRVGNDVVQSRDMRGLLTLGTENRDDKTRELIDMLVRENETLKARMEKLENSEYLETLKQLIVLQRQQISDLRQKLGVPDNDVTQEMDNLLGQIGVPINEARSADLSLSTQNTNLAPVETSTVESVIEVEPAIAPPVAEKERRGWLVWLMLGAAAALSALFIGMFAYYRRMVPAKQRAEDDAIAAPVRDYSSRAEPTLASFKPRRDEPVAALDDLDGDLTPVYAHKKKNEDNWLGDKVVETEADAQDLDATIREVQDAFEDLVLDDDLLNDLDGIEEQSLEGLTETLPQEPVTNIAPVTAVKDKPKKDKKGKKEDSNRRPDEEVRMSIAEKMAQYNPEEYRQEMESLGLLELDELSGIDDSGEEEIETVVYRAMMFCEFKKYDKARELIEGHMQIVSDPRLTAALEQVDSLEKEAAQASAKKAI